MNSVLAKTTINPFYGRLSIDSYTEGLYEFLFYEGNVLLFHCGIEILSNEFRILAVYVSMVEQFEGYDYSHGIKINLLEGSYQRICDWFTNRLYNVYQLYWGGWNG